MRRRTRNSLAVLGIWALLTAVGFTYGHFVLQRELDKLEKTNTQLANLPDLIDEVEEMTARHAELKKEYESRKKEIPLIVDAGQRYTSIIEGLDQAGQMKLDIEVAGLEDLGDWGYSRYLLRQGEGQFNNIYRFIYYLENSKTLQKIFGLRLTQEEKADDKGVRKAIKFQMELHSYFSKIPELQTSPSAKSFLTSQVPLNPFSPQATRVTEREIPATEVVADQVDVKLIIPGKALVQFKGSLIVLRVGVRIRGGVVSDIDPAGSKVEFTLDNGKKVLKTIQFSSGE
jgi:hypothetical protein